jgi:hypothetical protein
MKRREHIIQIYSKDAANMWTGLDWLSMVSEDGLQCYQYSSKFIYVVHYVIYISEIQQTCKKQDKAFVHYLKGKH